MKYGDIKKGDLVYIDYPSSCWSGFKIVLKLGRHRDGVTIFDDSQRIQGLIEFKQHNVIKINWRNQDVNKLNKILYLVNHWKNIPNKLKRDINDIVSSLKLVRDI